MEPVLFTDGGSWDQLSPVPSPELAAGPRGEPASDWTGRLHGHTGQALCSEGCWGAGEGPCGQTPAGGVALRLLAPSPALHAGQAGQGSMWEGSVFLEASDK